jgi:glycerate 2-kinase
VGRSPREWLEQCAATGLAAVHGGTAVGRAVRRASSRLWIAGREIPDDAGIQIVAIGKAAASMAAAAIDAVGERVSGGVIVTRDGHSSAAPAGLELRHAGHPVPDARSMAAGRFLLETVAAIDPHDVLLVLLSGGGSALTSCPADGLEISDIARTTEVMLGCGASIDEFNCLRKHLSIVAGGRLAAASRAREIHVLAISDVPGDRLDVIASGPCTGDPTRFADALAIVDRHDLASQLPTRVLRHLEAGARGQVPESIDVDVPAVQRVHSTIVASNADARRAVLRSAGSGLDLGEILRGEAGRMGSRLVALADSLRRGPARLLVAGGETVVRLRGSGKGGRNQELALAAAIALDRVSGDREICLLAIGSDGTDGPTDAAGGFVDADSTRRARAHGADPDRLLARNDSHRFLELTGGLVRTGPTDTNVMDLVLMCVGGIPEEARIG